MYEEMITTNMPEEIRTILKGLSDSGMSAAGFWAFVGAVIHRLLTYHQKNVEIRHDDITQIRKELKDRCDKLQQDSDYWRAKYYDDIIQLKEQIFNLKADNKALSIQIEDIKVRGWVPKEERERYQ